MKKFRKVENVKFWVPEVKGEEIEGVVVKKGIVIETAYGEMEVIEILTEKEVVRVGVSGGLKNSIDQVKEEDYIRVVFNGLEINQKTKRRFKSFTVEIAETGVEIAEPGEVMEEDVPF